MKNKGKGFLHLLLVLVVLGVFTFITLVGIDNRGKAENIKLGLDLEGGVSITYEAVKKNPSAQDMADTVYKMQKRVENYSTEAAVYQEGENRVTIDIPGVTDANQILEELGKAGSIEFVTEDGETVIDGSDISTAKAVLQQGSTGLNENVVELTLNGSGKTKFADATSNNIGKQIAIVYDGETISAPVVEAAITDGMAIITGQETFEEAEELASTIRIGALPLELTEIRSNIVSAKLGVEAIETSLLAGAIGFLLVIIFMIIVYRIPGLAASIALCIYLTAELLALNFLDITLTLPGIAGIILSVGMAVDANVIIFTRIKEELATGKTVRSAMKLGFDKALSAIIDGNVTTLIAAAVLWMMGSGTVKGFAQTLAIGIVLSMATALFVTKIILHAFYNLGCDNVKFFGEKKDRKAWDFVGNVKKTYAVSVLAIIIGVVAMFVNGSQIGGVLNYGLDFKGGTSTQVNFGTDVTINDELKKEVETAFMEIAGSNVEISAIQDENALVVKTDELSLDQRKQIEDKMTELYAIEEGMIQTESISATVSSEMQADAIISVIVASICMLLYIWIRFKDLSFGTSAVLALVHDVLVVLMVYAVSRISVGNTFIACMLTIVGYSINATIVIFDRIRENKAEMKRGDSLKDVVNTSITQTFTRSINTSLTTFLTVIMLVFLGVESVREFAIPLIAGIIAGGYSSVCVAGTLWYFVKTKLGKKKEA